MNIANNILRIMRQKGISRRELIERLKGKVDRTHVYRILRGETAMPTIDKVKEIANALEVDMEKIVIGKSSPTVFSIKKVLKTPIIGQIHAGIPLFQEENLTGYTYVPEDPIIKGKIFGIKIVGDSMQGLGIQDGDLGIFVAQPTCDNGDVVIAVVDGEAVLRRFSHKNNMVCLQPYNYEYQPIHIDETMDFRIVGKLLFTQRNYTDIQHSNGGSFGGTNKSH